MFISVSSSASTKIESKSVSGVSCFSSFFVRVFRFIVCACFHLLQMKRLTAFTSLFLSLLFRSFEIRMNPSVWLNSVSVESELIEFSSATMTFSSTVLLSAALCFGKSNSFGCRRNVSQAFQINASACVFRALFCHFCCCQRRFFSWHLFCVDAESVTVNASGSLQSNESPLKQQNVTRTKHQSRLPSVAIKFFRWIMFGNKTSNISNSKQWKVENVKNSVGREF